MIDPSQSYNSSSMMVYCKFWGACGARRLSKASVVIISNRVWTNHIRLFVPRDLSSHVVLVLGFLGVVSDRICSPGSNLHILSFKSADKMHQHRATYRVFERLTRLDVPLYGFLMLKVRPENMLKFLEYSTSWPGNLSDTTHCSSAIL